jgi:predicted membrane channel-forming protein YqfA (hemolysin III family)
MDIMKMRCHVGKIVIVIFSIISFFVAGLGLILSKREEKIGKNNGFRRMKLAFYILFVTNGISLLIRLIDWLEIVR